MDPPFPINVPADQRPAWMVALRISSPHPPPARVPRLLYPPSRRRFGLALIPLSPAPASPLECAQFITIGLNLLVKLVVIKISYSKMSKTIMKEALLCLTFFSVIAAFRAPKEVQQSAVSKPSKTDTVPKLLSGFYLATPDDTKKGIKVYNEDKYYFLSPTPAVTLDQADSVYKEYETHMKLYLLVFRFNQSGKTAMFDFTMKYQGYKIALVLQGKIMWAATIDGAMNYINMAGDYTEHQIDSLVMVSDREIKKVRMK